jgi:hypothetical protein
MVQVDAFTKLSIRYGIYIYGYSLVDQNFAAHSKVVDHLIIRFFSLQGIFDLDCYLLSFFV